MRLIHTGDLHLKSKGPDSEFSLECLRLLVEQANEKKVDALLLCGDVFDGERDYRDAKFFGKVISILQKAEMDIVYIPGNHESQYAEYDDLRTKDLPDKIKLVLKPKIHSLSDGVEILCIPHAMDYGKYSDWEIEKKKAKVRIAIAHGGIPGFQFLGGESDAGILNPSIFLHYDVSHVFLGHIHKAENKDISGVGFYYAGTFWPVRSKEVGIRGYNIVDIVEDEVKVSRIDFEGVGEMCRVPILVTDSSWSDEVRKSLTGFRKVDRVKFYLSGVAESLEATKTETDNLKITLKNKVRRIEFSMTDLTPFGDLLDNPFCKKFYDEWKKRKPDNGDEDEVKAWSRVIPSLQELRAKL